MWAYGEEAPSFVRLLLHWPRHGVFKAIAAHDGDEFVPVVLCGTLCACAALVIWFTKTLPTLMRCLGGRR